MVNITTLIKWERSSAGKIDFIMDFTGKGYKVTSCGRVFNKHNKEIGNINARGYKMVNLTDIDGKVHTIRIHQLVAQLYLSNSMNEGMIVNHINECKTDNYIGNLEWVTNKQNSNHGTRNIKLSKANSGINNINSKPVEYYETKTTERGHFKATCKNQGWVFEDFIEIFGDWYISPNGSRKRKYFYKMK